MKSASRAPKNLKPQTKAPSRRGSLAWGVCLSLLLLTVAGVGSLHAETPPVDLCTDPCADGLPEEPASVVTDRFGSEWSVREALVGEKEIQPQAMSFLVRIPEVREAASATYAVELRQHKKLVARTLIAGPSLEPVAWIDCEGEVVVGTPTLAGGGCFGAQDIDYDISFPTGYDALAAQGNWGELALQWKHKFRQPDYTYDFGTAYVPVSVSFVGYGDDFWIDQAEATDFVPGDPPGTWGSNWAATSAEMAIGATLFIDRWDSPAFTDLPGPSMVAGSSWVTYDALPFSELCADEGWNDNGNPIDIVDQTCADAGISQLCELRTTDFHFFGGTWYMDEYLPVHGEVVPGLFTLTPGYMGNIPGQDPGMNAYIGDPPEGEEAVPAILAELARRVAKKAVVDAPVRTTRYTAGQAAESAVCTKAVRMNDLDQAYAASRAGEPGR